MNWLMLLLPFAAGILMAVQGTINGAIGKAIGSWEGNFLVHIIATTVLFVLLFVVGIGQGSFERWRDIPWYGYISGIINVVIIYGVMVSIPKLGASTATTAIIVGQVGCAMLIDWFGWFGMAKTGISWLQIVGLVLMAVGGRMMLGK
jgi:transporter family-2 protein